MFDVLIIGGGASGLQCALVLGSALDKEYASDKKTGLISHQKASHLQNALFNNVLGLPAGTLGKNILQDGKKQLENLYPKMELIENEKVISLKISDSFFTITSNKTIYQAKKVVLALNYAKPLTIDGLDKFCIPHKNTPVEKNRIQLTHNDFEVIPNLYVCGTIAGLPSQFAIAAGSGAYVATKIVSIWNNNTPSKIHDKV